jgi:hypothetical protein
MRLFAYRIVLFITEILSVLFTPFVLMISLPRCAEHLMQFFRDFTVFEEGLGPVCKFALFDLKHNGNRDYGVFNSDAQNEQQTNHGKLEISLLNFKVLLHFKLVFCFENYVFEEFLKDDIVTFLTYSEHVS